MRDFSGARLLRALQNDFLAQSRRLGIATLALAGGCLIMYLVNARGEGLREATAGGSYTMILFVGGLLFASTIWNDLHHPLARFQYLMLPYSNLERYLSRYILTGPGFIVLSFVAYKLFELLANGLCKLFFGVTYAPLTLERPLVPYLLCTYLVLHAVAFTGGIRFRNLALPRTAIAVFVSLAALALVAIASMRIFYWDHFKSAFDTSRPIRLGLFESISPATGNVLVAVLAVAFCLWVLYLAWLLLTEHEVQDGL